MFIVAGLHVPVMPLVETPGNAGAGLLRQSGPMASKVGMIWSAMVMLNVVTAPHCPASGVKV